VALARAAAILGGDVPLRQAATLAGLEIETAARAADRLREIDVLLHRLDLQFVHPLVRFAVNADVPVSERATRHLTAARIVHDAGAEPERIAAHLLVGRATGDPWAVEQLRAAARAARARAAANSAVRYLERALEEPPDPALRPEVLAELGAAEAALGSPSAADHLELAAAGLSDPVARAELALQRGRALYFQGSHEKAAAAYNSGLAELPEDPRDGATLELHDALQTGFVATATLVPSLNAQAAERSIQLLAEADRHPRSDGQRQLLAQASVHALIAGEPAAVAAELAERAWHGGRLLEHETADGETWSLVTAGFCWGGDLERCIEVVAEVIRDAERHASPLAFATASYVLGCAELWQGRVDAGVADLETALDARRYGWAQFARAAAAFLVFGLIDTGEFARADNLLEGDGDLEHIRDLEDAARLLARAELRLAQGRADEALADAQRTGLILGDQVKIFSLFSWRAAAAQAALAAGDRDRARELADTDLAIAERTQILHARIRALRVRGLCERGDDGLDRLHAAVELGAAGPARIETIRALVDLGAALRRSNQRAAARDPLQRAADLAQRGGATLLYRRARAELAATGARPRREMLLGGPESLTASERRIAELAAAGQSNREIAQALFVTPKTVEYHLRNAYRKLDITTRHQLANALRE
jgi:DNA-binding CsgD family transcriptional regulator